MSLKEHRPSAVTSALAKDRLGVPSVIFFVISAAAPLTVVAGSVSTAYAATGVTGVPLGFLLLGAILGIFAVGYVTMARHVVNAGAFYAYTAKGLGRPVGVATAWVALLAYNALQVGLYGAIGASTQPLIADAFGVELPWWVIALFFWALTGALGLMRVDLNGKILAILLLTEIAVVLLFDVVDLVNPAPGTGYSLDVFDPANLFVPGIGAVIATCVASFSGFESSVVFAEESKDPRRTVPMATYIALAVISILYAFSAWAMTVPIGTDKIVQEARDQGPNLYFATPGEQLGSTVSTIGSVLLVTSIMAALIAFHNTISRYFFALGRERVLPEIFGQTSAPTGAPLTGSITQTIVGFIVIILYALFDLDPFIQMFFVFGSFGGLGVLLLLCATSVSVIAYFAKNPAPETAWRTKIAPAIASILLLIVITLVMVNFDTVLGVPPDSWLRWALPVFYVVAIVFGVLYGLSLRKKRPEVYAAIGMGAHASVRSGQ
ncbi:Amino acid transporter [Sinosporangium album]|uniref:Amino acid transporter n=1 Tax=Sinosporangium album TaxID=504805 RepID=A0A1G8DYH5_9ACTN|nr:APC family permease [Sinosporangium album]SDH62625.1 Amino acid transporter [Sinosporangium album]